MPRLRDQYKLKIIQISEIVGSNIRQAPIEESKQISLLETDQKKPIEVRVVEGGYQIIDGRRRVEAIKANGGTEVLAFVVNDVDDREFHTRALIGNSGTANEYDEACHILALEEMGYKGEEIAKLTGYSPATISTRKKLVQRLHPQFQEQLKVGDLKVSVALELTKMPLSRQEQLLEEGTLNFKKVTAKVREYDSDSVVQMNIPGFEDLEYETGLFLSADQISKLKRGESVVVNYQDSNLTLKVV